MTSGTPFLLDLNAGSARASWSVEARPDARRAEAVLIALLLGGGGATAAAGMWAGLWLALWIGAWASLFALTAGSMARAARRRSAWVVRAGPREILVNLRSFHNHRLDAGDLVVAVLPAGSIRSVTLREERSRSAFVQGHRVREDRVRRAFLDIAVSGDLGGIADAVEVERERKVATGRTASRVRHGPAGVLAGRIVRVVWQDETSRLGPALPVFGAHVAQWYPCESATAGDDGEAVALTASQQIERLRTIADGGRTVGAVALAKRLYGRGTTEARRLVDRLR